MRNLSFSGYAQRKGFDPNQVPDETWKIQDETERTLRGMREVRDQNQQNRSEVLQSLKENNRKEEQQRDLNFNLSQEFRQAYHDAEMQHYKQRVLDQDVKIREAKLNYERFEKLKDLAPKAIQSFAQFNEQRFQKILEKKASLDIDLSEMLGVEQYNKFKDLTSQGWSVGEILKQKMPELRQQIRKNFSAYELLAIQTSQVEGHMFNTMRKSWADFRQNVKINGLTYNEAVKDPNADNATLSAYLTEWRKKYEGTFSFDENGRKKFGSDFIANVQKDMEDQMIQGDSTLGGMKASFLDMFQVNEHDVQFGVEDMDGNFLRHIPRFGLAELYKTDANGRRYRDVSLKSRELGKSLYLLGKSAYMYQYLSEAAPTMLMMETLYTMEGGIRELKEDKTGNIATNILGESTKILNKTNIETITEYINAEFFGRSLTTKDVVTEAGVSRNKTVLALKNFHTIANLGLKGPVAIGALGSGFIGLEIQANKGMYITKKNLRRAQAAYFGRDPKLRALFEYFEITLEDMSSRRGDLLSSSVKDKFMNQDRWFEFLARADRTLDAIAMGAMAMNYGVDPQTGKLELLDDLPEGTKSLWDIVEFTENEKYTATGVQDRYITKVPGVENLEGNINNWVSFQQKVHRVGS